MNLREYYRSLGMTADEVKILCPYGFSITSALLSKLRTCEYSVDDIRSNIFARRKDEYTKEVKIIDAKIKHLRNTINELQQDKEAFKEALKKLT